MMKFAYLDLYIKFLEKEKIITSRYGLQFCDRLILHQNDVTEDASVFLEFMTIAAKSVLTRLHNSKFQLAHAPY
jgi:hypothetical protein